MGRWRGADIEGGDGMAVARVDVARIGGLHDWGLGRGTGGRVRHGAGDGVSGAGDASAERKRCR